LHRGRSRRRLIQRGAQPQGNRSPRNQAA
jgi:hypothetical protein